MGRQCPLCGSHEHRQAFSAAAEVVSKHQLDENFGYERCQNCRSVFIDTIPSREILATFYESEEYHTNQDVKLTAHRRKYYDLNFNLPARRARLLELGPGPGLFLEYASEKGWDAEGVEFSDEAAETGRRKGFPVHVWGCELESEAYDCVVMIHTFEHMPDPRQVLREVRRILKPGGKCLLEVPGIESWEFEFFGKNHALTQAPLHLHFPTDLGVELAATSAGMRVVSSRNNPYFSMLPATLLGKLAPQQPRSQRLNFNFFLVPWVIPFNILLSSLGVQLSLRIYELSKE